jgi:hypothetical protein
MFTLTIYFFVLNVNVEFVLIYRPHPVYNWQINILLAPATRPPSEPVP